MDIKNKTKLDRDAIVEFVEGVVNRQCLNATMKPENTRSLAEGIYENFIEPLLPEPSRLDRALSLTPPDGWMRVAADSPDIRPVTPEGRARHSITNWTSDTNIDFGAVTEPEVALFMARQALILRDGIDPLEEV